MILVTYSSVYGSSREYAEKIASELSLTAEDIRTADASDADVLVIVGGLYAGVMNGLKKAVSSLPDNASLVVVSVGLADPAVSSNAVNIDKVILRTVPEAIQKRTHIFRLRGRLDYAALCMKHKAMMWMLREFIKRRGPESEEDRSILDTYGGRIDFVDPDSVQPVVSYLKTVK